MPAERRARLESLTGLRAFAAFGVFLYHVNVFFPLPDTQRIFEFGNLGVSYFFVLSGFVLTWQFTAQDRTGAYYGRRIARIMPMLVLSVVAALAVAFWFSEGTDTGKTLWLALASVLLISAWFQSGILESPNPVTWSVSVEGFFYLLFPFLVRPIIGRTLRQLAIIAGVLVLIGWSVRIGLWAAYPVPKDLQTFSQDGFKWHTLGSQSPIVRLYQFMLGMVCAAAVRAGWRTRVPTLVATLLLAGALFVLWLLRDEPWRAASVFDALDPLATPFLALIISAAVAVELAGRKSWLGSTPMVLLGRWSYAFFLIQYLVLYVTAALVKDRRAIQQFYFEPNPPVWGNLGWAILAFAISLVLSAVLFHLFERPIERWARARLNLGHPKPAEQAVPVP